MPLSRGRASNIADTHQGEAKSLSLRLPPSIRLA